MSFNKRDGNAAQVAHGATRTLSRRDLLRTSAMIGLGFGLAPSLGWARWEVPCSRAGRGAGSAVCE
jgi:hypothetical protein